MPPYTHYTDSLPSNFAPPEVWPENAFIANPPAMCRRENVGWKPRGIRWSLWPLCFEEYISDEEPDLEESKKGTLAYNRLVAWKRITRTDVPQGWRQRGKEPWRVDGFHILSVQEDYTKKWSNTERRHITTWQKKFQTAYRIEELPWHEFADAYCKSSTVKKVGSDFISSLKRKYLISEVRPHLRLWGTRNMESRAVVAGTAILNSPTFQSSVCEGRFILPEGRNIHAATALMDFWFGESQRSGVNLLHFSYFWHPGVPDSWKGFSDFKSHFDLEYVAYPPTLTRFVRGKFL